MFEKPIRACPLRATFVYCVGVSRRTPLFAFVSTLTNTSLASNSPPETIIVQSEYILTAPDRVVQLFVQVVSEFEIQSA